LKVALITINETFLFWITTFFLSRLTNSPIRNNKLKERQYNGLQNILVCINHVSRKWRKRVKVRVMVLNATFNNISVILWLSDLLVELRIANRNFRKTNMKFRKLSLDLFHILLFNFLLSHFSLLCCNLFKLYIFSEVLRFFCSYKIKDTYNNNKQFTQQINSWLFINLWFICLFNIHVPLSIT
jgi:hypothetical protein